MEPGRWCSSHISVYRLPPAALAAEARAGGRAPRRPWCRRQAGGGAWRWRRQAGLHPRGLVSALHLAGPVDQAQVLRVQRLDGLRDLRQRGAACVRRAFRLLGSQEGAHSWTQRHPATILRRLAHQKFVPLEGLSSAELQPVDRAATRSRPSNAFAMKRCHLWAAIWGAGKRLQPLRRRRSLVLRRTKPRALVFQSKGVVSCTGARLGLAEAKARLLTSKGR